MRRWYKRPLSRILDLDDNDIRDLRVLRQADYFFNNPALAGKKGWALFRAIIRRNLIFIVPVLLIFLFIAWVAYSWDDSGESDSEDATGESDDDEEMSAESGLLMATMLIGMGCYLLLPIWKAGFTDLYLKPFAVSPIERKNLVLYNKLRMVERGLKTHLILAAIIFPFVLIDPTVGGLIFLIKTYLIFFFLNGCILEGVSYYMNVIPRSKKIYLLKKVIPVFIIPLLLIVMMTMLGGILFPDGESVFYLMANIYLLWVLFSPLIVSAIAFTNYFGSSVSLMIVVIMGIIYCAFLRANYRIDCRKWMIGFKIPDYLKRPSHCRDTSTSPFRKNLRPPPPPKIDGRNIPGRDVDDNYDPSNYIDFDYIDPNDAEKLVYCRNLEKYEELDGFDNTNDDEELNDIDNSDDDKELIDNNDGDEDEEFDDYDDLDEDYYMDDSMWDTFDDLEGPENEVTGFGRLTGKSNNPSEVDAIEGIMVMESINCTGSIRGIESRIPVSGIIFALIFAYPFYLFIPGFGEMIILGMILMNFSQIFHNVFTNKLIRLVPEKPEKVVEHHIRHIHMAFIKVYFILAIPFLILISIPYTIPGLGEIVFHPISYYITFMTFLPILMLSLIANYYSMYMDKKKNVTMETTFGILKFIILCILTFIYVGVVLFLFNFSFGGILGSHLIHCLITGCFYVFSFSRYVRKCLGYLRNYRTITGWRGFFLLGHKSHHALSNQRITSFLARNGRRFDPFTIRKGIPRVLQSNTILHYGAFLIAVLIILFSSYADHSGTGGFHSYAQEYSRGPIPYNDSLGLENETFEDQEILQDTNIIIRGNVTFDNLTLTFSNDGDGLYVLDQSNLTILNSTITSKGYFPFEVYGILTMDNCTISRLAGNRSHEDFDGGIEIYEMGTTINNTTIHHCRTNGILATRAWFSVSNSTFHDIPNHPISIRNTIARVDNCTIYNSSYGIYYSNSKPVIKNNHIHDTDEQPLTSEGNSEPILVNNTTEWEGLGIDDIITTFQYNVVLLVIIGYIVISKYRKEKISFYNIPEIKKEFRGSD